MLTKFSKVKYSTTTKYVLLITNDSTAPVRFATKLATRYVAPTVKKIVTNICITV